jgi:hypothetical protein
MYGSFSEEALEQFAQLAAQTQAADFAEGDTYDFTRCVRPNGTAYGTRGKCRKGTESAKEPKESIIGNATPAQRAAMENKAHQMRNRNAQADRAALAKKVAKELGKDVTAVEVAKEAQRRQEGMATKRKAATTPNVPVLTKEDMKGMSEAELRNVKKQMNERAFGKGGAPLSNEKLQAMFEQNKLINAELASRGGSAEARPTAKKATSVEAKATWSQAQGAVKSAATEAKRVASETKGDKSPEARAKRLAAGAALDKAEKAAFRASEKFFALSKRENRAAMTPEQRKLEREADKLTKGG